MQLLEAIEHCCQREVERAQAEDRRHVRGIRHKRIVGYGQHGGNGIGCEEQIGNFDGQNTGSSEPLAGCNFTIQSGTAARGEPLRTRRQAP